MEKVSVLKCKDYDIRELDQIIERHFQTLEEETPIIRQGSKVVIKPNLVMRRKPEEATTTHPEFVAAIIRAVKRRGGEALIAESPGGPYTRGQLRSIYAATGMEAVAAREGALLNLDVGWTSVPAKGRVCGSVNIIDPILKADVVISAAKLKTHCMTSYSGAVKNLFGVVPGLMKPELHYRYPEKPMFGEMLVDLCETVKPAVSFIDAVMGMEGNGPTGGTPKFLGLTAASLNPHALDLFMSRVIGMTPEEVPTLVSAVKRELCPANVDNITLCGDFSDDLRVDFQKPESQTTDFFRALPDFLRRPIRKLITPKPVILKNSCVGCGKCAESCPQKTIRIVGHKAVIDYTKCIKCYCCHEMCPEKSIDIKKFALFRF